MTGRFVTLLSATAMLAAMAGAADAREGVYVRGDLGYSFNGDFNIKDTEIAQWGSASFEDGWMASAGAGYAFTNGARLEGELGMYDNSLDDSTTIDGGGDISSLYFMANAYYDFNRGQSFEPFVGAGIGYANIDVEADDFVPTPISVDDSSGSFAWQFLAGVAFNINEQAQWEIAYRYLGASDVEVSAQSEEAARLEGDYSNQAITFGVRYSLTPPAPPPLPPAPPPRPAPVAQPAPSACPASEFVVYFDWDRAELNQAAQETIQSALNRARQCNISGAQVVGHTDTSGDEQYNMELSQRRSAVVRDALVAGGVSASLVQTSAQGESDPARATADGVREPLNRRSAVTIRFR